MKTHFFTSVITLFVVLQLNAQIFSDDFESYAAGRYLVFQAGAPWHTTHGNPGTAQDPLVTTDQAQQGIKSFVVEQPSDCYLDLGNKTSGRYKIDFYMYIPSGKAGFYYLLTGLQSYEEAAMLHFENGTCTVDAGGVSAAIFSYPDDQWFHMENYVDLDHDWAEIYIDGQYVYDWQWTAGAIGLAVPKRLYAVEFLSYAGKSLYYAEAYYDNITYENSPSPLPPLNLTATLDEDIVSLQWNEPSGGAPDTYYVFRNHDLIATTNATYFQDTLPYPGYFTYEVKAYYTGSGMSLSPEAVTVQFIGGTERNYVLVEIATGTQCHACPGAAMGADDLIANGDPVAVIEYHSFTTNDPFANDVSFARAGFYNVQGFPTAFFDGGNAIIGGSATQSKFPDYHPVVMARDSITSIFDMLLGAQPLNGNYTRFNIFVNVTMLYDYPGNNLHLLLTLTESDISYNWQNQTKINNTCRDMYPDQNGTEVTFEPDVTQYFQYAIDIPAGYVIENCNMIAFIQDFDTKEVLQTQMINLGQYVGTEHHDAEKIFITPNPVSDILKIQSSAIIKRISVFDLNGKKFSDVAADSKNVSINLSCLPAAVYLIKVQTETGVITKKISVK